MNPSFDLHDLVNELKTKGEPFAIATVVRTLSVTSAKAGAKAVIMHDGGISGGWIGGGCARSAVLKAAREAIDDGTPRLVSIQPEDLLDEQGLEAGELKDGIKYALNMCPSQGSMDIFVEAVTPKPELVIMGASPVAVALVKLGSALGFSLTVATDCEHQEKFETADTRLDELALPDTNARRFIVVSTQGCGDEAALRSALTTQADYVAFVGSSKKAESLKAKLIAQGLEGSAFRGLKAPAGLDIKAITPEEIALSILAEIVEYRRSRDRQTATLVEEKPQKAQEKDNQSLLSFVTDTLKVNSHTRRHAHLEMDDHPFMHARGLCC